MAPRTPPDLLTTREVALLFRVDPRTVVRWADSGKLTALRTPGGSRRYLAEHVHKLLAVIALGSESGA